MNSNCRGATGFVLICEVLAHSAYTNWWKFQYYQLQTVLILLDSIANKSIGNYFNFIEKIPWEGDKSNLQIFYHKLSFTPGQKSF